ncbi:hypothetical protein V5O48_015593, partial [Marasmius crinis-equi]
PRSHKDNQISRPLRTHSNLRVSSSTVRSSPRQFGVMPADSSSRIVLQSAGFKLVSSTYLKEKATDEDFRLEVEDDLEAEREALADGNYEDPSKENDDEADEDDDPMNGTTSKLNTELKEVLKTASKGVSEGTDASYRSLMAKATAFVRDNGWISSEEEFFRPIPHPESAEMVVAWIMDDCDSYRLDGTVKPAGEVRSTYAHAQKMRAAATFGFGRVHGLGNRSWEKSEVSGKMVGNPSCSQQVSLYMISLRRRKTRAGETPTSARAITSTLIGRLYDKNMEPSNREIKPYAPGKRKKKDDFSEPESWGGGRFRRMLHCAYVIAFACLLRVDEVLNIQVHDIEQGFDDGDVILTITLPFRKTEQFGEIKPFILRELPDEMRHLCPVRAYADWIAVSEITEGFLFRKIDKGDLVSAVNKSIVGSRCVC